MSEDQRIVSLVGRVGGSPKVRQTSAGDVMELSMAVTTKYGDRESGTEEETQWFDVSIWNEGLQQTAKREATKGTTIAVIGALSKREHEGRTYLKVRADRLGLVEWMARSKSAAGASRPAAPAAASNSAVDW